MEKVNSSIPLGEPRLSAQTDVYIIKLPNDRTSKKKSQLFRAMLDT